MAFDSLYWNFILADLHKMHFPEKLVSWIKACICTPSYYVKLNRVVHGYFKGTQGIRQGDLCHPTFLQFA